MLLPYDFYLRPADIVARELLGKYLKTGGIIMRITETEAYLGLRDKACHSYGGRRTKRTEAMYLTGGHAYVYFIYGNHFCLNAVTGATDDPSAVLLRAGETIKGGETVARRRYDLSFAELSVRQVKGLSDGPGKLCQALGVDRSFNGKSFFGEDFCILESPEEPSPEYIATKRIGLGESCGDARELPLRYLIT